MPLDVVTGAFSYTGAYIADRLLAAGRSVRTLTRRPAPEGPIEARTYVWEHGALAEALAGADTLYNTYWVRVTHGQTTFDEAVENSRLLFEAAVEAGVRRIVHVSISNADQAPHLPYFAGKAAVEAALKETAGSFAIVRPTVVFSERDVLINNIAWLLRRSPVFFIAGDGKYRVRPVHVDDVARVCVEQGPASDNVTIDAVGPDDMTFEGMVAYIRDAIGSRSSLIHVDRRVLLPVAWGLGMVLRDHLMTGEELDGLMENLVTTDGPATGIISFKDWVDEHAADVGRIYVSEVRRNYQR
jgi:uncharacterized protein YbjT (DUF2867 family)